ncbi:hypothetical protein AAHE18_05G102400 [Arachis hypogaea]
MQWSQQVQSCQHRHPCSWHANNGVIRLVFCCSCWIFNCTFSISTIFTKIWVLEHILLLETYTKDSIPALHKIRKYLVEATEEASIAYNKALIVRRLICVFAQKFLVQSLQLFA